MHYSISDVTKLWENIESIRWSLRFSHKDVADMLLLTLKEYETLKQKKAALSAKSIMNFTLQLEIDPLKLIEGTIDIMALVQRRYSDRAYIPERYQVAAFSRRRTSIHILDYLNKRIGPKYVDSILWKFDLDRAAFTNPDLTINIRFLTDLCSHLHQHGASYDTFYQMGVNSTSVNKDSPFAILMRGSRSVLDAYDLQINHLSHFYDQNYNYRILFGDSTSVVIESTQRENVLNLLQTPSFGSTYVCTARSGVMAAMAGLMGLPVAHSQETHCIHRGDSACRYHVNFEEAARSFQFSRRPELQ